MIAVIFELEPRAGMDERYFQLAEALKGALSHVDGFVSIERFRSLSQPERYLSLSFWLDEEAVNTWRQQDLHRAAQAEGRAGIFANYRLRVAHVLRDYSLMDRGEAPVDL